jgi:hypothetical protein
MKELCDICGKSLTQDEIENGDGDICNQCYWDAIEEYDEEMRKEL